MNREIDNNEDGLVILMDQFSEGILKFLDGNEELMEEFTKLSCGTPEAHAIQMTVAIPLVKSHADCSNELKDKLSCYMSRKKGLSFGDALGFLKYANKKIARAGWNGKGMYVYMVRGTNIAKENLRGEAQEHVSDTILDGASVDICSHIDMKAADGSIVVGWLASQTDILAEDWIIL